MYWHTVLTAPWLISRAVYQDAQCSKPEMPSSQRFPYHIQVRLFLLWSRKCWVVKRSFHSMPAYTEPQLPLMATRTFAHQPVKWPPRHGRYAGWWPQASCSSFTVLQDLKLDQAEQICLWKITSKSLTQHLSLLPNFKSLLQSRGVLELFSEKVTRNAWCGVKQILLPLPLALAARSWPNQSGWIFPSKKSAWGRHPAWKKSPQKIWQSFSWLKMGSYNGMCWITWASNPTSTAYHTAVCKGCTNAHF